MVGGQTRLKLGRGKDVEGDEKKKKKRKGCTRQIGTLKMTVDLAACFDCQCGL